MYIYTSVYTSESDPHSYEATIKAVGKKAQKKFWGFNGFEPMTSVIPVGCRCSTNWALKPSWEQVKSEFNYLYPLYEGSVCYLDHTYVLQIENISESDPRSYETIAVAKIYCYLFGDSCALSASLRPIQTKCNQYLQIICFTFHWIKEYCCCLQIISHW